MSDLLTKTITITALNQKQTKNGQNVVEVCEQPIGSQYPIRYSIFQKKQDGNDTQAWTQVKGLNVGDTAEITYKEEKVINQYSKQVTYRNIVSIKKATQATTKSVDQPDWDKIAEGKVRFGFAIEAYKKDKQLNQQTINEINDWTRFIMNVREDTDINVEEIPWPDEN